MRIDEPTIDRLFKGIPIYPQKRLQLFVDAAVREGHTIYLVEKSSILNVAHNKPVGHPFIGVKDTKEALRKLPKLAYQTLKEKETYYIIPL